MTTSHFEILYVCNGDNARSTIAAACTRALITAGSDLAVPGVTWRITSAGTEATAGAAPRSEAFRAADAVGVDLSDHQATPLLPEHCTTPDLVLAMSWDQISHIWSVVPEAWDKVFTMKEFVHWAKQAPSRPPILFPSRADQMRDKVIQTHLVRKRARADHGFWGGIRPQDLNLIEPNGKGDEAWVTLGNAVSALASDVITLLRGPDVVVPAPKLVVATKKRPASKKRAPTHPKTKAKTKARR